MGPVCETVWGVYHLKYAARVCIAVHVDGNGDTAWGLLHDERDTS